MSVPALDPILVTLDDAAAVAECHGLLVTRARWLRDRGIDQWGVLLQEPLASEINLHRIRHHAVYLFRDAGGAIATVCLQQADELVWPADGVAAIYVHGIATRPGAPGVGRAVLIWCEEQARRQGKTHVRLDCVASNPVLLSYYAGLGFESRGECKPYDPVNAVQKWEKRVTSAT